MRFGFNLPQIGPAASPQAVIQAARRAEELGYDSLWVTERLLYPTYPQNPYAGSPDGKLPEVYQIVLDPLVALTYAAANTTRVTLGTSVLVMSYYNPVMLARQLTSLDVFSGGRVKLGLGQGWSQDEHDAMGVSLEERARRADEFIQVLKTIWTQNPAAFKGEFFQLPESIILPKPVQKPHPPILLAFFTPAAMRRAAQMADGVLPLPFPSIAAFGETLANLRAMAREAGRERPLQIVTRANVVITEEPVTENRFPFIGAPEQIREDIAGIAALGVDELHFDPSFSPEGISLQGFLSTMERLRALV